MITKEQFYEALHSFNREWLVDLYNDGGGYAEDAFQSVICWQLKNWAKVSQLDIPDLHRYWKAAVHKTLRRQYRHARAEKMWDVIATAGGHLEKIPTPTWAVVEAKQALTVLTEREQEVCELSKAGYKQREIAERLGIAQKRVSVLLKRAAKKLLKLEEEYVARV